MSARAHARSDGFMQRLRRYEPKHSAQTSGKPPAHDCDRCATASFSSSKTQLGLPAQLSVQASFSSSKAQLGLPAQLSVQHPPSWGAMMPDEALQQECRKRYVQGVAVRVRKHGVAFPGATPSRAAHRARRRGRSRRRGRRPRRPASPPSARRRRGLVHIIDPW